MKIELTPAEARVLGVLLEKEATTPESYPLSLNAVTTACNQRTNRDPVMDLTESEVQSALDRLLATTLVRRQAVSGGRVPRWAHRLSNRLSGELEFSEPERAVLCVLVLCGAQTSAEIRVRAGRLCNFSTVAQVERVLEGLASRDGGPYAQQLPRLPGRREDRYGHLLCGAAQAHSALPDIVPFAQPESALAPSLDSQAGSRRIAALEVRVSALEAELKALSNRLDSV